MSKKTKELFLRFQAIYGGRWRARYASEAAVDLAIAEWAEVIELMDDEQLVRAMTWAKYVCQWPPSLAAFLHAGLAPGDVIRARAIHAMRKVMATDTYREQEAPASVARRWRSKNSSGNGARRWRCWRESGGQGGSRRGGWGS